MGGADDTYLGVQPITQEMGNDSLRDITMGYVFSLAVAVKVQQLRK